MRLAGATARAAAVNAGRAVRAATAVDAGKAARFMSRALGRGGGTTLPGHIADRIDPGLVAGLARALPNGCVLITGTNGKTTVTTLVQAMLTVPCPSSGAVALAPIGS